MHPYDGPDNFHVFLQHVISNSINFEPRVWNDRRLSKVSVFLFKANSLQSNSGCYCWHYSVLPDKADDDSRLHQAPLVPSRPRKRHAVEKVHRIPQSRLQHLHSPSTCANQQKSHFPRSKLLTKLFTVLSAANVAILALPLQNTVCLL